MTNMKRDVARVGHDSSERAAMCISEKEKRVMLQLRPHIFQLSHHCRCAHQFQYDTKRTVSSEFCTKCDNSIFFFIIIIHSYYVGPNIAVYFIYNTFRYGLILLFIIV